MANTFEEFSKTVLLATGDMALDTVNAALASLAKEELAKSIADGSGSRYYTRYVNGREAVPEEAVVAPGPIVYEFIHWPRLIRLAITFLEGRSPIRSGRYSKSWLVMVDGAEVQESAWGSIRPDASVAITNRQPYHRKIDTGHMVASRPRYVMEDARTYMKALLRGGGFDFRVTHVVIPQPYILKGVFSRGARANSREGLRRDTKAGQTLTYPALVMKTRYG